MRKQISDGWHDITDHSAVYTENGMVLRAIYDDRPATVYRCTKDGYTSACPMRYDTFRRGYLDDRYVIR